MIPPLNHVYVFVDPPTYDAIQQHPFVRNVFATSEDRTTVRSDLTYSGVYFYGTNTYFEFLDAETFPGAGPGNSGIAFGAEQQGALQTLATERPDICAAPVRLVTRDLQQTQVPWFYELLARGFDSYVGLRVWLMEYHPRFLQEWRPTASGSGTDISRAAILRRYSEVLPDRTPGALFRNIRAVTIEANPDALSRLSAICTRVGLVGADRAGATVFEGDGWELRLTPGSAPVPRIRSLELDLHRPAGAPAESRIGQSVLRLTAGPHAVWAFE